MERRSIWTGVVAGVAAAAVLLTVGVGAYRAGQDDEVVTRVVGDGEPGRGAEVVRVVGDHHDRFGPGPFFFLVPLLLIVLVVLLVRRAAHGWGHGGPGGWGHGGPGYGGWGPGRGGPGGPGDRGAWLEEWHRRAHEEGSPAPTPGGPPPAGTAPAGGSPDTPPPGGGASAPSDRAPGDPAPDEGPPAPTPSGA
jgi:hypothetical protein